ncbi:MAG: hypothetical protein J5662_07540 [Clostridia bacterium]|nr:hypothetical protein [Clostridia bacterium]
MSIKFIKVRFNTNVSLDKKALDVLKGVDGQNAFIKNAILSYAGKGREDIIAEKIVSLLDEKLQSVPIIMNPTGTQDTDTENNADMDIADAFLDSL